MESRKDIVFEFSAQLSRNCISGECIAYARNCCNGTLWLFALSDFFNVQVLIVRFINLAPLQHNLSPIFYLDFSASQTTKYTKDVNPTSLALLLLYIHKCIKSIYNIKQILVLNLFFLCTLCDTVTRYRWFHPAPLYRTISAVFFQIAELCLFFNLNCP